VSRKADFCEGMLGTLYVKTVERFFLTQLALLFLDFRVHPEVLGVVMDKKLVNTLC